MKVVNIIVNLTKNHHVPKLNVSPMEVVLLAAEHNFNSGGNPVEVDKTSVRDVAKVKVATDKVDAKNLPVMEEVDWTEDLETRRLRGIYGKKVDKLSTIRTLPKEFEGVGGAVEVGRALTSPDAGPAVIAKVEIK